jgi:hypothetical protein
LVLDGPGDCMTGKAFEDLRLVGFVAWQPCSACAFARPVCCIVIPHRLNKQSSVEVEPSTSLWFRPRLLLPPLSLYPSCCSTLSASHVSCCCRLLFDLYGKSSTTLPGQSLQFRNRRSCACKYKCKLRISTARYVITDVLDMIVDGCSVADPPSALQCHP